MQNEIQITNENRNYSSYSSFTPAEGTCTLGISGWGCAAGTLEPLAYTCPALFQLNLATLY